MGTISISGLSNNTAANLSSLIPVGSYIDVIRISSANTFLCNGGQLNFTVYNGQNSIAAKTVNLSSGSWQAEVYESLSGSSITNNAAFQSSKSIKVNITSSTWQSNINSQTYSITIEYTDPYIWWDNPTLTLSQSASSLQVTATKGGTATHTGGATVTYYLYEGSTQIGQFSGNTMTFTPSVGTHSYTTVAKGGGVSENGKTTRINVVNRLTWSNASLSLSQSASSLQVTATMGGSATHTSGSTVTYYLYEGSTQIGTFSNGSLTFTSTAGNHTYKTVASAGGLTADGTSTAITVAHRLTWSNATLSLAQSSSSLQVTATMGGTATHTGGSTVTYYLYEGSTQIGTFSNGSLTFTSTVGSHTYKTVASAGGLSADGASASVTVVQPVTGTVGYYDGTAFVECEVYRHNGTEFEQVIPYYYDGTDWVECSQ